LHGLNDATVEEKQIRAWWTKWPDANIAIAIPAGFVAVDVDGDEGDKALQDAGHELPRTVTSRTGRGRHLLFRTGEPVAPKVGVLPHVDLRGPGSYIVAPPSRHASGKTYEWILSPEKVEIAPAPAWIHALSKTNGNGNGTAVPIGEVIPQGQRNRTLASLGGTMRRRGMSPEAIEAALLSENRRCNPPLPDGDVRRIAKSVSRYEPAPRPQEQPRPGGSVLEEMDVRRMLREGIPKPVFDLEDFLVRRTVTYLTGSPKGFKTWLALAWTVALAADCSWAGLKTQGNHRVVFVEAESPAQIPERFHRSCLAYQVNPDRVLDRVKFLFPKRGRLRLDFPDHFQELRRIMEEFKATWLVIDSFIRIHGMDENSSRDMAGLANSVFLPLRDQLGCGVLILDHPPKPLHEGHRTRKEQIRGSWEKLAAADVQIHVETRDSETGKIAGVSVGASRMGPERDEPLWVRLRDTPNGGTRFEVAESPEEFKAGRPGRPPTAKEKAATVINAEVERNPALTFKEAMQAVVGAGVSKETGKRAWREMKGQGSGGSQMVLTPDPGVEGRLGSKGSTPLIGGDPDP
jgi:hypothetical protein